MPKRNLKTVSGRKNVVENYSSNLTNSQSKSPIFGMVKKYKLVLILLAIIGLGYLSWQKGKGVFLAGSVNGGLITKAELNSRLNSQFGKQMLEVLIGEKLIMNEAAKQNVTVTVSEIDAKIKEFETTLGPNTTLDQMLEQRGMTKADLVNQVKLQLTIDKMFGKDVSVSAQEIADYLKTNAAYITSSDSAQRDTQAQQQVKSTKIEQKFTEWFTKVRDEAKILRFL